MVEIDGHDYWEVTALSGTCCLVVVPCLTRQGYSTYILLLPHRFPQDTLSRHRHGSVWHRDLQASRTASLCSCPDRFVYPCVAFTPCLHYLYLRMACGGEWEARHRLSDSARYIKYWTFPGSHQVVRVRGAASAIESEWVDCTLGSAWVAGNVP